MGSSRWTPSAGSSAKPDGRQYAARRHGWRLVCPAKPLGFGEKEMIRTSFCPIKLARRHPERGNTPCPLPLKKEAAADRSRHPRLQEGSLQEARASIDRLDAILVYTLASGSTTLRAGGKRQSRHTTFPLIRTASEQESSGSKIWRKRLTSIPRFAKKFLNFIIAEVISTQQQQT